MSLVLPSAEIAFSVPFHDLDPLEIAWHGHYARYFELARCALLQSIDYDYPQMRASGYAWPVVELHIRYAQALHYQQQVLVRAQLAEWENRLKIKYLVRDAKTGRRLTHGHTLQVAVDMASREMCFVTPAVLREKLGVEL